MRVRVLLQYYFPHVSGLSKCAKDIAEYISNDHDVEVLTYQTSSAPQSESLNNVSIKRFKPTIKIGRANFSFNYVLAINRGWKNIDAIHLHLPCPDALFLSYWRLRKNDIKLFVTYQCDPENISLSGKVSSFFIDWSSRLAIKNANHVIVSSVDYANNSRMNSVLRSSNMVEIPPGSYRSKPMCLDIKSIPNALSDVKLGFLGRITSEKGIELLLEALEIIGPSASLIIAGPTENLSENDYALKVLKRVSDTANCKHLGLISEDEKEAFFRSIDVLVVPSTNSLEAFGIVQIEAMSNQTPVVASNLPGVRTIIESTGYGSLFNPISGKELVGALMALIQEWPDKVVAESVLKEKYEFPIPEEKYLHLFNS